MKKITKLISLVCFASVFALLSCSSPSSSSDEPVTYIGTKTPAEAKAVGDIVFNDGSATPYADIIARADVDSQTNSKITKTEKDAAIAVIFYVGTDCSNGSSNDLLTRTLGVGLKHNKQSGLQWCRYESETNYATAYNVNITSIKCVYDNGVFSDDKNGLDNFGQIRTFYKKHGHQNDTSTTSNYPAFDFGMNYSTKVTNLTEYCVDDWYLPSFAELYKIYEQKSMIDSASELCGGDKFDNGGYWSSSQYGDNAIGACTVNFNNGDCSWDEKKSSNYYVCAIHEF